MPVHQRIKQYMECRGLAVSDISQKAGISEIMLQAILNGAKTLYVDELRAICLALNVSPEAFVEK